jgi:hypothetical protein
LLGGIPIAFITGLPQLQSVSTCPEEKPLHAYPIRLIVVLIGLSACSSQQARPDVFAPTRDPLTRFVAVQPDALLAAGATALREIGFQIADPVAGAVAVYSDPIVVQTRWRDRPVANRILCGVGTAATSDTQRVQETANRIPIELRLGYRVEARPGTTAMTLIFEAQGRRMEAEYFATPTMACTLTVPFVDELFDAVEAKLPPAE